MQRRISIVAAIFATTACHPGQQANDNGMLSVEDRTLPTSADPVASGNIGAPAPPPHGPSDAPPPIHDKTARGAIAVATAYCDALRARGFGDAYSMWGENGRASGLTGAEFAQRFAAVNITSCDLGPAGEPDGAAGSIYLEIPAIIRGKTAAGRSFEIEGPIILRRVNDVDGSSQEQRRWHIARAEFPSET